MRTSLLPAVVMVLLACADNDSDGKTGRGDCDDADSRVFRGALEVCDGVDNNCNGQIDEGVAIVAWQDRDGDGYGDPGRARRVCTMPEDGVDNDADCNDLDAASNPDGVETCDGLDNDCNGEIDEGLGEVFFPDGDGDGYGVPGQTVQACFVPLGFSRVDDDCDDTDPSKLSPSALDLCDGIDNDCDGEVDEDAEEQVLFVDADGDGFGAPGQYAGACGELGGAVANDLDCDDSDPSLNPDTVDVPGNSTDDDCDGYVDEIVVPGDFPTIAAALAGSPDGVTIQIGEGLFSEDVDLRGRDVVFAGEGCGRSILIGTGSTATVRTDGATVAGMRISGGGDSGIKVTGDATVREVCLEGNYSYTFGGGIEVLDGLLTLEDSRITRNVARLDGGGISVRWVPPGEGDPTPAPGMVATRLQVLGNTSGIDGGGLTVHSADVTITASVFAGNEAFDDGAAMSIRELARDEPPGPPPHVSLVNVTLHDNLLGSPSTTLADNGGGTAIYTLNEGTLSLENTIISNHQGPEHNVVQNHHPALFETTMGHVAIYDNGLADHEDGFENQALREDPFYVDVRGDDPLLWDLRLRPGSPLIDAGDPSILLQDPDGSTADIGAYGGPDAVADFDASYATDSDGDGMCDPLELAFGLQPWRDDAAEDLDADGIPNGAELIDGTDPTVADSDGDGRTDGDEVAAGLDPLRANDFLPHAALAPVTPVLVGETISLDARSSFSPVGLDLTYTWTLTPPGISSVAVSGTGATVSFVPDISGPWIVAVDVDDGGESDSTQIFAEALAPDFIVPDDRPSVDAAVLAAAPGDVIAARPGTWDAGITVGAGVDVRIVGLGATPADVELTVVAGTAALVSNGGTLQLDNLTVTGASSSLGGGIRCIDVASSITLRDVVIRDNAATGISAATGQGGGMRAYNCTLDLERVVFRDNTATNEGGGLYCSGCDARLRDVRFLGNHADNRGGGAYLIHVTPAQERPVSMSNVVFQANTGSAGTALWVDGPTGRDRSSYHSGYGRMVYVEQVVFADHRGADSVVHAKEGRLLLANSLWVGNDATQLITAEASASAFLLYAAIWDNTGGLWSEPRLVPAALFESDPRVLAWTDDGDATNDLWTLRPSSPLLDAGWLDRRDGDGSRAALGPAGGDAPRTWWRDGVDLDHDGMSDGWELRYGLDPEVDDADGDLDGDSSTNLAEYLAMTRPDLAD